MLRAVAVPPPRPTGARPPLSSITREVAPAELSALVDASRPPEEVATTSLGGAEMDALLASERPRPPDPPKNVIHTNTPSAQASAMMTTGERPRVSFPSMSAEATVVLAPELTAPRDTTPLPPHAPPLAAPFEAPAPFGPPSPNGAVQAVPAAPVLPVFTPAPPSRTGLLFVLGGAMLLAVALGAVLFGLRRDPGESGSPVAAATSSPGPAAPSSRPSASPSTSPTAAPSSASAPAPSAARSTAAPGTPEAEAYAALSRLREGVATCARDVIGVLPGTSPAVPSSFSALARGPYKSAARDFRSPVFSCVKYRETAPQRFQIQWQIVRHPGEGRGVVWFDGDGDGKADRALGFRAALVRKNEVDLGEIGPLEPMPGVMKAPD